MNLFNFFFSTHDALIKNFSITIKALFIYALFIKFLSTEKISFGKKNRQHLLSAASMPDPFLKYTIAEAFRHFSFEINAEGRFLDSAVKRARGLEYRWDAESCTKRFAKWYSGIWVNPQSGAISKWYLVRVMKKRLITRLIFFASELTLSLVYLRTNDGGSWSEA